MTTLDRHVRRCLAAGAAVAALVGVGLAAPTASAATPDAGVAGSYLALGDSVAFGYQPPQEVPPPDYLDAASFSSYANDVAGELRLHLVNASCPGETTISMLAAGGQSNGCENSVGSPLGYRSVYPLHVSYSGTQEAYAVRYLSTHPATKLVSIDIGANDTFVCEETTADHCTSPAELAAVLAQVKANVSAIMAGLRDVAGYHGTIVVLDYYALDYTDAAAVAATKELNDAINAGARPWGVVVADGLAAFRHASAPSGSACTAGLLIKLPDGTCNVHPTASGHLALAAAITEALAKSGYPG